MREPRHCHTISFVTGGCELFAQHERQWREFRYVYPVISRRSGGLSIGINLNPNQSCNFDCIYCSVDRTEHRCALQLDLRVLERELDGMLALAARGQIFRLPPFDQTPPALRRLNDIAFSGDGEPTLCRSFSDACRLAVDCRDHHRLSEAKIVVITNASRLHVPRVRDALAFLDRHGGEIWAKLDAGTQAYHARVTRSAVPLSRILANIFDAARARPLVIQSMFMAIDGAGPDAAEITAYVKHLATLKELGAQIKLVQIYTVARRTAEANVAPLNDRALNRIVKQLRDAQLPAEAFYGVTVPGQC